MKIIIEGCDGVGKSSVAEILAERLGLDVVHFTGDDPKNFNFYYQTALKENVVYDRHTIGELVYPKVFGRKPQINMSEAQTVINESGAHFFVLTADLYEICDRILDRGVQTECEKIIDNIEYINAKFVTLAYELKNVILIDTTDLTAEEVADSIMQTINEKGE